MLFPAYAVYIYIGYSAARHLPMQWQTENANFCKFLKKFIVSDNMLCQVFKDVAMDELALLASNAY